MFTKRAGISGTGAGQYGTSWDDLEEWSAPYSSQQTSTVISVTWTTTFDAGIVQAMAVTGTYNNGCSFDPQAASTTQTTTSSSPNTNIATTQTTVSAHDLLFGIIGAQVPASGETSTWGGTNGAFVGSGLEANPSTDLFAYVLGMTSYSVSAAQVGTAVVLNLGGTLAKNGYGLLDALTSDPPPATGGGAFRMLRGVGK